jgi:sodium/bile acid cotransporter 7
MLKLGIQVLVPVALGMLLHPTKLGALAMKHANSLKRMDQAVILLIVYISFCESFAGNMFSTLHLSALLMLMAGMAALFGLIFFAISRIGGWMHFSEEDKITALFCGTKKSLVHGTVMSKVLFAGIPASGLVLLPIMLYHALQLIMSSMIAKRMAARNAISYANTKQPA